MAKTYKYDYYWGNVLNKSDIFLTNLKEILNSLNFTETVFKI